MSFADLLPVVQGLPREDKLKLVHLLVDELAREHNVPILQPNGSYPVWTPLDAYEAADALRQVLAEERAKS